MLLPFFKVIILFQLKHLVCDFFLQTAYMAFGKEKGGTEWVKPLMFHAFIHSLGTLLLAFYYAPKLWYLAPLDFFIHAAVDRLKGSNHFLPKLKNSAGPHIVLAIDQMVHHLTHYYFAYLILKALGFQ